MNISKQAWHYKAISKFGSSGAKEKFFYGSHTTCTYIRALVWAFVMMACFAIFCTIWASFAVICVASMVTLPFAIGLDSLAFMDIFNKESAYHLVAVMGVVGWGVFTLFGGVFGIVYLINKYKERQPSAREKAELIKQAYQDKVDGVCTLVKIVD